MNTEPAVVDVQTKLTIAYRDYVAFLDASERTVQTYTGNIRQFVKWVQERGIEQPTRADVIAYRDELRARCSPATVQGYITALRLFFRWTAAAGIYPNIADNIKGARTATGHKKDYLTSEQIGYILDSIGTDTARGRRDYAIIALMVTGGLRDVEVSRANVEDLRQLGGSTVLYLQGKGRDDRTEYVKVVPEVERAIRAYLKTRKQKTGPLFASMSNNSSGERLTPKSVSRIVKQRMIDAGYDSARLTAHSLRHSAVTLSLQAGVPLEEVQEFARHRNISTTQIYAHNLDRLRNRSEDAIATALFRGNKEE